MARNVNVISGTCVEWTTELPYQGRLRFSSNFAIGQDSSWYLEFRLTRGMYDLRLRNAAKKNSEKPFTVKTYYQNSKDQVLFLASHSVVDGSCFIYLWNESQSDVLKKISNLFTFGELSIICLFSRPLESNAKLISEKIHVTTQTDFISSTFSRDLPSLSRDFSSFVEDETFSDVKLKCGDSTFSAHKSVLAARSEVFAAMFRNKMAESETGVVDVQDLDPNVLKPLLKYMYSGEMPDICEGTTRRLYEAADKYAVYALKKACSESMVSDMTQQNCLDLLVLADVYSDEDFKDAASSFVADHLHLLSRESWSTFKNERLELAVEVFEKRTSDALSSQT